MVVSSLLPFSLGLDLVDVVLYVKVVFATFRFGRVSIAGAVLPCGFLGLRFVLFGFDFFVVESILVNCMSFKDL